MLRKSQWYRFATSHNIYLRLSYIYLTGEISEFDTANDTNSEDSCRCDTIRENFLVFLVYSIDASYQQRVTSDRIVKMKWHEKPIPILLSKVSNGNALDEVLLASFATPASSYRSFIYRSPRVCLSSSIPPTVLRLFLFYRVRT